MEEKSRTRGDAERSLTGGRDPRIRADPGARLTKVESGPRKPRGV